MAKKKVTKGSKWVAQKYGFKSGLEENISNQIIFRSFHCSSLALLSLKNTIHYGLSNLLNPHHSIQRLHSNSVLSLNFFEIYQILKINTQK